VRLFVKKTYSFAAFEQFSQNHKFLLKPEEQQVTKAENHQL